MFITFEGINGSGKTTQSKRVYDYLISKGKDVVLTKEPGGGGDFCMALRNLIVQQNNISKLTELFLLYASRMEHIRKVIQPALNESKIVICDRFIDSTYAYQCCYDWDMHNFVNILHKKIGNLMPDITFFIDISVEESEFRLAPLIYESSKNLNNGYKKYDELKTEHMQKIVDIYHKLHNENQDRIFRIDGTLPIEEITKMIIKKIGC